MSTEVWTDLLRVEGNLVPWCLGGTPVIAIVIALVIVIAIAIVAIVIAIAIVIAKQ